MVFQKHYAMSPFATAVVITCSVIIVVDIASAILHMAWGSVAARKDIAPQNRGKMMFYEYTYSVVQV